MDERNNRNVKPGFPPGYEFQSRTPRPTEGQRRNNAMSKGLSAASNAFPGGIPGTPVSFRDDGGYDVEETSLPSDSALPDGDEPFDSELIDSINSQLNQPAARPSVQRVKLPNQNQQRPAPQPAAAPAPQRATTQNYRMAPNEERLRPDHPVLKKIYQKFGLKEIKTYELKLAKGAPDDIITIVMTSIPDELQVWAIGEAQAKSAIDGDGSGISWYEALTSCSSIVAIEGEPVWKLYNIQPKSDELGVPSHLQESTRLANNPFDIPTRIRKITGKELANLFWSDTVPLMDKIHNFYIDKIIAENRVLSDFETNIAGKDRFVCPVDGCDVIYFEPLLSDEDNNPLPYYCKVHGTEMVRSASPLAQAPESKKP